MEQNTTLKFFISYSHQDNLNDNPCIEQFKRHTAPLKNNGFIEDWYDREIFPGEDYQKGIDNNLEEADIIGLFISSHFLSSQNCMDEKKKALKLRKIRGVVVIPIILSHCGWLDDKDLSKLLALPLDGKPLSSFPNRDEAWHDVYNGLKKIIEKETKINQVTIKEDFAIFLQDTEMLSKAHSQKESVFLDDIFIYPELDKCDNLREYEKKINSEELLNNISDYSKIIIAGEDRSGKTTICKRMFQELRSRKFVPVYVSDKKSHFSGIIEHRISNSFYEQYKGIDINEIDKERIIPIIDDFHLAKAKEKHINHLSAYPHCILIVDDIFSLNIKDDKLTSSFFYFKIREFKPSLRHEIIMKWVSLIDKEKGGYKNIDEKTELINSILGKTIARGIMPAYPFFILSAIVTFETFATPLEQEITSQGYCYQAFIYFYLRKKGVRTDEIDTHMNFLTELAFYIYRGKKYELTPIEFTSFITFYLEKYTLPIKQSILLDNLSQIVFADSFNNYSFRYPYLYYFFVAKYLSEHPEDKEVKEEISRLISNLQVTENAYIVVFLTHHSKNINILEEIAGTALDLFDKYKPGSLNKDEVRFFDKRIDIIVGAALPSADMTAEKGRMQILKMQDEQEQSQKDLEQKDYEDSFVVELRRAIRTVEVMGCIIKNRVGSLEKARLERLFAEGMNVHLRILSYFFELIKSEDNEKLFVDYVSKNLRKVAKKSEEEKKESDEGKMRENARIIFWNLNYLVTCGIIYKIIHSLGSDKLLGIVRKVCDEVDTPASFLVKHGILMWYSKNLQLTQLEQRIKQKDFSEIAKKATKLMVANHCSLHAITYKDRQRIESKLGIPIKKLLTSG